MLGLYAAVITAQGQPIILSNLPPNNTTGVGLTTPVIFNFSASMNKSVTWVMFYTGLGTPLTLTPTWNTEGTWLTNTPNPPFPANSPILWMVSGQDLSGARLGGFTTGGFMTGTGGSTLPTLVATSPTNGATGVLSNTPVRFLFNVAMNTNLTTPQFYANSAPSQLLAMSNMWTADRTMLFCFPVSAFPVGQVIFWNLQGQSAADDVLPGATGSFTTAVPSEVETNTSLSALFSRGECAEQFAATLFRTARKEFTALALGGASGDITVGTPAASTHTLAASDKSDVLEFTVRDPNASTFATNYPPGAYQLRVDTTGQVSTAVIPLTDDLLPAAPRLLNWQSPPRAVLAEPLPLEWVWDTGGAAVDYVRLRIEQGGAVVFATPLPDLPGALNAASNQVVVPGGALLQPGLATVAITAFSFTALETNAAGLKLRAARHRTTTLQVRVVSGTAPPPLLCYTNFSGLMVGDSVMYPLRITNGARPVQFTQTGGALPPGLELRSDGSITGQATAAGTFDSTVRLTDLLGQTTTQPLRIITLPLSTPVAPRLENIGHGNGSALRFDLVGGAGAECQVQRSFNLVDWTTEITTNVGANRLTVEVPITGDAAFFRVRGPGTPLPTPHPLTVAPLRNNSVSASASMDAFGGTMHLTNTAGCVFTLTVPPGALDRPEVISMTEIEQLGSLPLSGGLRAAVDLQPEGLLFHSPVRLDIAPPAALDPNTLLSFTSLSDGRNFALHPSFITNNTLSLHLLYFRITGTGAGNLADVHAQATNVPDDPLLALNQNIAAIQFACRLGNCGAISAPTSALKAASSKGASPDDAEDEAILQQYIQTGNQVIIPKLRTAAASADDATVDDALSGWTQWVYEMQCLGIANDIFGQDQAGELGQCMGTAAGLASTAIWNGMTKACQECLNHDLSRIARVESLARTAVSMGWDYDAYYFECAQRCLIFELKIESKITSNGSEGTYVTDTKSTVKLTPYENEWLNQLIYGGYKGEAAWEVKSVNEFDVKCDISHAPVNGTANIPLAYLTLFQQRCNYVPGSGLVVAKVFAPDLVAYLLADVEQMPREGRVAHCPDSDPSNMEDVFGPAFSVCHSDILQIIEVVGAHVFRLHGFERGEGDILLKKWYVTNKPLHNNSVEERTTMELHHTPQ